MFDAMNVKVIIVMYRKKAVESLCDTGGMWSQSWVEKSKSLSTLEPLEEEIQRNA